MFKPNAKIKKLFLEASERPYKKRNEINSACAYVYPDGIVLWLARLVPGKEHKFETYDEYHTFPCQIDFYVMDYCKKRGKTGSKWDGRKDHLERVVIHDPAVLVDGLKGVRVYFGNGETNGGCNVTTTKLTTASGAVHTSSRIGGWDNGITVQPNIDYPGAFFDSYDTSKPGSIDGIKDGDLWYDHKGTKYTHAFHLDVTLNTFLVQGAGRTMA